MIVRDALRVPVLASSRTQKQSNFVPMHRLSHQTAHIGLVVTNTGGTALSFIHSHWMTLVRSLDMSTRYVVRTETNSRSTIMALFDGNFEY
jgi:hypothetical protein